MPSQQQFMRRLAAMLLNGELIIRRADPSRTPAAIGDYDNDGDLDWFVTSIQDPNGVAEGHWGVTGNRLYRNSGGGVFEDATDAAGVRHGYWGWGACFADFDLDGWLDIFHVNGFGIPEPGRGGAQAEEFERDPSRLFLGSANGDFRERSAETGIVDPGQGRGLLCFDYYRDGDIDLFIANNGQAPRLYRNDREGGSYLAVKLVGTPPSTEAIGARVWLTAGGITQMRELRAGTNFESQDPAEAHFGLAGASVAEEVRVRWPDGRTTVLTDVAANRRLGPG